MSEPAQVPLGFVQRIDLLAAQDPRRARRHLWFNGLIGLWALVSAAYSLAVQHWMIATLFAVAVALSGVMWWVSRRAIRRIPETSQWIRRVSSGSATAAEPAPEGDA